MSDFSEFVAFVTSIKDKDQLEDFLLGLTTENERKEFLQRVEIIKRLVAGEAHAKIAQELGVGVATVTRGSKELAQGRFKVMRELSA